MEIKYENDRIIQKWRPVIENVFEIKNDYLINLICIFCEKYSQKDLNNDLPQKLNEIKSKLTNLPTIRIIGSYYNPYTGKIQHNLENGLNIDENGEIDSMDEDKFIYLFGEIGVEILRDTDPAQFREGRINNILS
jgi:predicted RND superfamily exporter protein